MKSAEILEKRKTNAHYTFQQWLGFLDQVYLTWRWRYRVAAQTGEECWLGYYEDGYTPEQAAIEDLNHAQ